MKELGKTASNGLFVALAALMMATRFHHFGTALHLPDASMAIFFLGGLYLRRHWQFVVFALLAGVIDWAAISFAGTDDFCISAAYSFLLPAYAVLWYGGYLYADRLQNTWASALGALAAGVVSASLSFLISNGAFYWLGAPVAEPNLAQYLDGIRTWGPLFVGTTMAYLAAAVVVHALVARLAGHEARAQA